MTAHIKIELYSMTTEAARGAHSRDRSRYSALGRLNISGIRRERTATRTRRVLRSHRRKPVVQMRCTHCRRLPSTYCEATSTPQGSKRGPWSLRRNHRLYGGSLFVGSDLKPPTQLGQAFLHAEDSYTKGSGLARLGQ